MTDQIVHFKLGVPGGDITLREATLEPKGGLTLYGPFPATDAQLQAGITVDKFRSEFGAFTFVIEYDDGRVFECFFSQREVDGLIAMAVKEQNDLLRRPAGIIRRRT